MKNLATRANLKCYAAILAAGVLIFGAAPALLADAAVPAPPTPPKHGLSFEFNAGPEKSEGSNYFGLPKEAFDRLSPEQIVALAKSNETPAAMIVIVPVAMFAMIIGCVWLGVSRRNQRAQMHHETLRLLIEKGQPIPPELLQGADGFRRPRNDLRNGLVLISVGLGLGTLLVTQGDGDWPVALIPLLMGVAFLIAGKIESKKDASQSK